jgi:bacterioferritin-associated ferredoxin
MILCLCRGVAERDVVEAIRSGARSIEDVSTRCSGAGGDCGACQAQIERHLRADCQLRSD